MRTAEQPTSPYIYVPIRLAKVKLWPFGARSAAWLLGAVSFVCSVRPWNRHWFNTAAFVNPAPFAFGNSPRSVLRGPGIATTDLTLEKSIALTDAVQVD